MRRLQIWKWRAISTLVIVTFCQALKQDIGEECTNENGITGICQFRYKCSKNTDLGAVCNSEQTIICCAKNISGTEPSFSSNEDQKDVSLQSRFGFIPDFFNVPTLPQNSLPSINFFNHQKQKIPNFGSNVFHQSLNTMHFVEDRPLQSSEQDVGVTKTNKRKIITTRPTNKYELHNNNNNNNNNHNSNIEDSFDNDQTTRQYQNYHNINKYPNHETQMPNQNHYSNKYPNFVSQRPNYNQHDNINQPYQLNQNKYFNRNPNYFTSTQKLHENYDYNSQLPNSQISFNSHEENKRPYENNNYRPTSSSIMFPNGSTNDKSSTKFTTTTNKYYEYQNRPNEYARRISEIKCEEYSKSLTTTISALPLSIDTAPKPVSIEKCDTKGVGLIVGGAKAELGEFPHMVALGFRTNTGNPWNCGGTLISEQFVLTAAHCTHSALGNPERVRLGDLNLQKNNDGANPVEYLVDEIFVHPDYVSTSKYNDIALIRLNKIVKLNNHIRPACLYNKNIIYSRKVTATGWGSIEYGDRSSDDLLKVDLDVIDNQQCNKLYEAESKTNTLNRGIINSMMCAGDLAGGHDTCLGDSGGPLVIRSEKNACVFNLVGITSFGKFCATENSPGVYTRVSAFLPWIEQIVWP